jgi:hypothetical protein
MLLALPRDLSTPGAAISFLKQLPTAVGVRQVTVDFSMIGFAKPYATLLVAEGLRDLVRRRKGLGLDTRVQSRGLVVGERQSAASYLGHIGFFEYVGVQFGNAPGVAPGSSTYLPLTVIHREQLEAERRGRVIQEAVLEKSRHLASMIFVDESQQDLLTYCLREIIRNVFEHAQTDSCTIMAQKYYADQVEVAIADNGRGIQASLGADYEKRPAIDALYDAIKPGVSRIHSDQGLGRWDNSGFGLYVTSRLGRETGSFTIASSGQILGLSGVSVHSRPAPVTGTAIRLVVSASEAEYFPNRLQQIVDEGEAELAAQPGAHRAASKGTRMSKRGD